MQKNLNLKKLRYKVLSPHRRYAIAKPLLMIFVSFCALFIVFDCKGNHCVFLQATGFLMRFPRHIFIIYCIFVFYDFMKLIDLIELKIEYYTTHFVPYLSPCSGINCPYCCI